ncbi:hypothetical protein Apa02nite_001110 [Actinoplanes palleronii]|uniref:Radical SAM core domain-containing protein n=2 Tax=Actinoplanes palleronii TaxID=113570 RepID=A0ABQ4B003_9ACTN|nr:hypothetical protein Apa02nite_001110 [Actinoplanes palleronii]
MTELLGVPAMRPETGSDSWDANAFKLNSIDLYITSFCNRRCTFCFLSDAFLDGRERMPVEMVRSIVAWAEPADEVTILGGEPALHPDFAEIVQVASARHRVRTVTNGSRRFRAALADPAVAAALSRVAVSIDAPTGESMDRLRGRGAFADAVATIRQLQDAGIPYDINCTVVRSCLAEFPEMLAFAERMGAQRLNVHWYSAVGRGRRHAAGEVVSPADWRTQVLEVVRRYRPPRPDYVVDVELSYAYGLPGEDRDYCAVRDRANLQFLPSGAVFSCGLLVESESRSAYEWRSGTLYSRAGDTELSRAHDCTGCPFRSSDDGYTPLCIYNRLML